MTGLLRRLTSRARPLRNETSRLAWSPRHRGSLAAELRLYPGCPSTCLGRAGIYSLEFLRAPLVAQCPTCHCRMPRVVHWWRRPAGDTVSYRRSGDDAPSRTRYPVKMALGLDSGKPGPRLCQYLPARLQRPVSRSSRTWPHALGSMSRLREPGFVLGMLYSNRTLGKAQTPAATLRPALPRLYQLYNTLAVLKRR